MYAIFGPKPTENFETWMFWRRAAKKWPHSWTAVRWRAVAGDDRGEKSSQLLSEARGGKREPRVIVWTRRSPDQSRRGRRGLSVREKASLERGDATGRSALKMTKQTTPVAWTTDHGPSSENLREVWCARISEGVPVKHSWAQSHTRLLTLLWQTAPGRSSSLAALDSSTSAPRAGQEAAPGRDHGFAEVGQPRPRLSRF